jgi:hypothetical protein
VRPDEIRSWLAPPDAVAAGYRVVTWRGPCPDELVPALCQAGNAMADAPLDDLEHEEWTVTPALVRAEEAKREGRIDAFRALALTADGRGAGFTDLGVSCFRPTFGFQGNTVVVGEHRGHRLGWWLKAANLLNVLAVHPDLRFLTTTNAESNPWMLAINEAMGYRPHRTIHVHQGPLADASAQLRERAVVSRT